MGTPGSHLSHLLGGGRVLGRHREIVRKKPVSFVGRAEWGWGRYRQKTVLLPKIYCLRINTVLEEE